MIFEHFFKIILILLMLNTTTFKSPLKEISTPNLPFSIIKTKKKLKREYYKPNKMCIQI